MPDRYVNIVNLRLFNFTLTISIGNPKWFIHEIKKLKGGNKNAKSCKDND